MSLLLLLYSSEEVLTSRGLFLLPVLLRRLNFLEFTFKVVYFLLVT